MINQTASAKSLRPPHRVNQVYQLRPMGCCFIAICICIKPSQTHGPVSGWSHLSVIESYVKLSSLLWAMNHSICTTVKYQPASWRETFFCTKGDDPGTGPWVCDGLIQMHTTMKQHCIRGSRYAWFTRCGVHSSINQMLKYWHKAKDNWSSGVSIAAILKSLRV